MFLENKSYIQLKRKKEHGSSIKDHEHPRKTRLESFFFLEETQSGQTNLVLNQGLLITSIAENDSYQDVIERIISECVTVREIMEESADKLEDHLVLGSEETK